MTRNKRLEVVQRCGVCGAWSYHYAEKTRATREDREEQRAHRQCMAARHWTRASAVSSPVLAYQQKDLDVRVTP